MKPEAPVPLRIGGAGFEFNIIVVAQRIAKDEADPLCAEAKVLLDGMTTEQWDDMPQFVRVSVKGVTGANYVLPFARKFLDAYRKAAEKAGGIWEGS